MASVFDAAKYILEKMNTISAWKLQKLCYYAQAWALAWTGEPLFQEDFEAWANGPVCPVLFHAHQGKYQIHVGDIKGNSDELNSDQKDTIDRVLAHYGAWDPYELREQTHGEKPWREARGDLPEGASSTAPISKASMGEYYGSL